MFAISMDILFEGFTSPALEFRSVVPQFRSPEKRESDVFENVVNHSFAHTHIYTYLISQNGEKHRCFSFLLSVR